MKKMILSTAVLLALSGCGGNSNSDETDFMSDDPSLSADTASVEDTAPPPATETAANPEESTPAPEVAAQPEAYAAVQDAPAANTAVGTGNIENYTVQKGDTLMKVAFNLYGDIDAWRSLYELNKDALSHSKALRVGQQLKYDKPTVAPNIAQNGEPFLIRNGDTLGKISDEVYATPKKWRVLYENNRQLIKDANRIYAGFYLYYQMTEADKKMAESRRAARSAASVPSENLNPSAGQAMPQAVTPAEMPPTQ